MGIHLKRRAAQLRAKLHLRLGLPGEAVALLDYDRRLIKLGVSSAMEYHTRLHSCKKEPETVTWIEQEFMPGDVFYDIGANVGAYSLVAAAFWGPRLRIVAIEPSAVNFARLLHNLTLNGCAEQVTALPIALAQTTGIQPFHYSNLDPGGSLHALGQPLDFQGEPFRPIASCPTLAFDLDTLVQQFHLPSPTHLKLDVDGSELTILRGAERTLRTVRSLLVELDEHHPQSAEALDFLKGRGFHGATHYPYRYGNSHPEFKGIENVLFRREDNHDQHS